MLRNKRPPLSDYKTDRNADCECDKTRKEMNWIIGLSNGNATFHKESRYNKISTTKFSLFNFIIKFLFLSFRRFGNLYFLFIALIQLINPDLSVFRRWISIVPLTFYLFINWAKQIYFDQIRRYEDKKINDLPTRKGRSHRGGMLERGITWKDIAVGDIIQLKHDEVCPADIVVLDTSITKNKESICYIETERVNGLIGYEEKKGLNVTKFGNGNDNFQEYRKKLTGKLEYDAPNDDIFKFNGILKLRRDPKAEIITIKNLVLRGSVLRNTEWIYGICVYVGNDTKIMRNTLYTKEKRSYFEKSIQKFFLCTILIVLIMSLISTIIIIAYKEENYQALYYEDHIANGLRIFFYLILYSPTIPISIYGSLDLIALIQKWRLEYLFKQYATATTTTSTTAAIKSTNLSTLINNNFSSSTSTMANNLSNTHDPSKLLACNVGANGAGTNDVNKARDNSTDIDKDSNNKVRLNNNNDPQQQQQQHDHTHLDLQHQLHYHHPHHQHKLATPPPPTSANITNEGNTAKKDHLASSIPLVLHHSHSHNQGNHHGQQSHHGQQDQHGHQQATNNAIKILDPSILANLGQVEYCFIDKTSTLTTGVFEITKLYANKKVYQINEKHLQQEIIKNHHHKHTILPAIYPNHSAFRPSYSNERETMQPPISHDRDMSIRPSVLHDQLKQQQEQVMLEPKIMINLEQQAKRRNEVELESKKTGEVNEQRGKNENNYVLSIQSLDVDNHKVAEEDLNRSNMNKILEPPISDTHRFKNGILPSIKAHMELNPLNSPKLKDSHPLSKPSPTEEAISSPDELRSEKILLDKEDTANFNKTEIIKIQDDNLDDIKSVNKKALTKCTNTPLLLNEEEKSMDYDKDQSLIHINKLAKFENNNEEREFIDDFIHKHDIILTNILTNFTICHTSHTRFINEDFIYESASPEELAILKFAKICGKTFERANRHDNPTLYTIRDIDNNTKLVKILGINEFSYSRKRSSIVYKLIENKTEILAKGPDYSMKDRINFRNESEIENFDKIVESFKKEGLNVWVFAKRNLDENESLDYYTNYQNLKGALTYQADELKKLADSVERNLELITIVGMKDNIRKGAIECINTLKRSNIKCWLLTGDDYENAVNVAKTTDIINANNKLYRLKSKNKCETIVELRNILSQMKKFIDEKNDNDMGSSLKLSHVKYKGGQKTKFNRQSSILKTILPDTAKEILNDSVAISGETLDIILNDMYLKTNFAFICSMCHAVVGYRLSPNNKRQLVKLVKGQFVGRPITLAIGDGLNDALMFQKADISFEMEKPHEILPSNAGDIKIQNFEVINELLLVHGRSFANKTENVILYLFYKAFALGFPLFFFNWYASFTGTIIQDSMFVFLNSFLFTFFPIIIYGGFDKSEPEEVLKQLPALYIDGRLSKMRLLKTFGIRSILEGCIHAAIAFYLSLYCVNSSYSPNGLTTDFDMISLVTTYSIVVITNIKILWIFKRYTILCISLILFSILSMIIYVIIYNEANSPWENYTIQTLKIFQWPGPLLTLIFIIITSYSTSYFIAKIIMAKLFPTLFDEYIVEEESLQTVENARILKNAGGEFDFSRLVQVIYKYPEYMDPIVEEMLSPADENINALGMHRFTLRFFDKLMEKHFQQIVIKTTINHSKIMYIIFLIIYGCYSFAETIINQNLQYGYIRLGIFLGFVALAILLFTKTFMKYYERIMLGYIFLAVGTIIALYWSSYYDSSLMAGLVPILSSTIFNVGSLKICIVNAIHYIVFMIRVIILYGSSTVIPKFDVSHNILLFNVHALIGYTLIIGGIAFLSNLLGYKFEKDQRNEHAANAKLEIQLSKSNDVLSILLPKFVKDKLEKINGPIELAEDQGEVTILFCDILDFDTIIKSENTRIVSILDYIFRKFDELCTTYGVQKIETVGKTYMACSGLKSCEAGISKHISAVDPTKRIINMGFAMLNLMQQITYNNGNKIKIKIGVNYGTVIAGVIGYHKPQFSLIGDTVNTASRMCSTGKNEKINISYSAKRRLKDTDFIFIKYMVEAKGLGQIPNYVVEKRVPNNPKLVEFRNRVINVINVNKRLRRFDTNQVNNEAILKNLFSRSNRSINNIPDAVERDEHSFDNVLDNDRIEVRNNNQLDIVLLNDHNNLNSPTTSICNNNPNLNINSPNDNPNKPITNQYRHHHQNARIITEVINNQKLRERDYYIEDYVASRSRIFINDEEKDSLLDVDYRENDDIVLKPNKWLLTFEKNEKIKAEKFEKDLKVKNKRYFKNTISILFGIHLLQTLILITIRSNIDNSVIILCLRSGFCLLLIILLIFSNIFNTNHAFRITAFISFLYGLITALIEAYIVNIWQIQNLEVLEFMLIYLIGSHFSGINFFWTLNLSICSLICWLIIFGIKGILDLQNIFYFCLFIIINIMHSYIYLKHEIKFYNNLQIREKRKMEQKGLVSQLLPLHCIEKYFNDPTAKLDIQDEFENVTLLFADIKGFTEYSNSVTPSEVVKMLSELFTRFDIMCLKYSIYKVYTIGDCYVALSFNDQTKRDYGKEAHNMVQMAISMIEIIKEVRAQINFNKLNMRIGLHTGRIIGGIIGTDIVRYDIYGPDVLIANKMESNGVEGNINVSEDTKNLLEKTRPDYYKFEPHVLVKSDVLGITKQSYLLSVKNIETELRE